MAPFIGIGNSIITSRSGGIPSVLRDGASKFMYISSVISATKGITKDGSNLVSKWADYLESGRNLLQATGTNQPLWSANGVLFDGIDNFMKCVAFTWNQPEFIYMVARQVTWTNNRGIFDGDTLTRMLLYQQSATPRIDFYAGATLLNTNFAVNTWSIIRCLADGVNSKLQINNTAPTTGDVGANNAGGFTLGAYGDNTSFSNIEVKEIIGRDSAVGEAEIYAYLKTKYGL